MSRGAYSLPITQPPITLGSMMLNQLGVMHVRRHGSVAAGSQEVGMGDSEGLGREAQVKTVEGKGRWERILR